MPDSKLPDSYKLFLEHYLQCWNATEAAHRAWPEAKRSSCWTLGWRALKDPRVQEVVQERLADVAMGADEVLARLADQARFDPAALADALQAKTPAGILKKAEQLGLSHLIKAIKRTKFGLNVEFHDSQKALELLGRHHKLFVDRVEHSGKVAVEGEWTVSMEQGA